MAFDPNAGGSIDLSSAADLTKNWRDNRPTFPRGFYFSKTCFDQLLTQGGCVGIRTYCAESATGEMKMVMVGVDSNGDDILGSTPLVMDYAEPCPATCSSANSLNS